VEPCELCIEKAKLEGVTVGEDSRYDEIEALKDEIADLKRELAEREG
jgi:AmiR/NasT family two-component response regulator